MDIMGFKDASGYSVYRDPSMDRVTSTQLHRHTKEALKRLQTKDAVAVTQYNEVQGYLVAPERYEALLAAATQSTAHEQGKSLLTMVMTAGLLGAAIPSESFAKQFPDVPIEWEAVAQFAAAYPVTITHGPDGEPITRGRLTGYGAPADEYGSDDDLNLA